MEKNYRFKYRETNKVQQIGNSLGIPIPKDVLKDIGITKGEELHIYVNNELKTIMLFRPKDFSHKNWNDASFELSVPFDVVKEFINQKD